MNHLPSPILHSAKADTIVLTSDRLCVEIGVPGQIYNGSRFDWSAFITQVTLDGRHRFCAPEAIDGTGTNGIGLCSEFGIREAIGFEDTAPGDWFTKPGVGLLRRPDRQPYDFSRDYEINPFATHVAHHDGMVEFITEPLECGGYAMRTIRRLRVDGPYLTMEIELANVGRRPIVTTEYCHNFVAFNGRTPGEGLILRLPQSLESSEPLVGFRLSGNTVQWPTRLNGTFYAAFDRFAKATTHWWWELTDTWAKLSMREDVDMPPVRFALYATDRIVSPEVFVGIDVAPGKRACWRRRFTFQA